MKLILNIFGLSFAFLLVACGTESTDCDRFVFSTLFLHPVNCTLSVPQYRIKDSLRYGGKENELTYNVETLDSAISMTCFVTNYDTDNGYAGFDIDRAMKFQKGELVYDAKSPHLIKEQVRYFDSTKVGYVKYYIETEADKFYEGRIFFFQGRRFVTIYLTERCSDSKGHSVSISDCIYKSLVFK